MSDYVRRVERILYAYKSILAGMENEAELEREGLGNLFPAMVAQYGGTGGGRASGHSDSTAKYGVMRAEKSLQVRQIERGLAGLTHIEHTLIVNKFFDASMPPDSYVYTAMGLGSTAYYKLKSQAIRKMAVGLNIL